MGNPNTFQIRAALLGAEKDQSVIDQMKRSQNPLLVQDCRGRYFKLFSAIGENPPNFPGLEVNYPLVLEVEEVRNETGGIAYQILETNGKDALQDQPRKPGLGTEVRPLTYKSATASK